MWRWVRLTHRTPLWVRWAHRTPHWVRLTHRTPLWVRWAHRTPHWVRWAHRTPHWGATARTSNEVRRATLGEELVEQLAEPGGLLEVHHVRGAGHAGMAGVRRFAFHEVRHREDVRRIQ